MNTTVIKNYTTLEDVEVNLINLRNLMELLYEYFDYPEDYVKKNPAELGLDYSKYGALTCVCIDAVDSIREQLNMAQMNYEMKEMIFDDFDGFDDFDETEEKGSGYVFPG